MDRRTVKVHDNWRVRPDVAPREENLFYDVLGTFVGAMYTPISCASKITGSDEVEFFYIAICEYVTMPPIKQYVSVSFKVVHGKPEHPSIATIGPEKVNFELEF